MEETGQARYLIVGLGNPGREYQSTRHNIGFEIVKEFAEQKKISFQKEKVFKGELAKYKESIGVIFVFKPLVYMNLSGEAVRKCIDFYQIALENILIVSDDFALPFGELRLRGQGSSGGHNGLKSIEEVLGTQNYCRLRCGIGEPEEAAAKQYVLEEFTIEERKTLPEFIARAVLAIEEWLSLGVDKAMKSVNSKK